MLKIGEKLNSSIPKTGEAMKNWDEEYLRGLIRGQIDAGADFLDVNCALAQDETAAMIRTCALIRACGDVGIMLDSPNPAVILEAAKTLGTKNFMINSVTVDERLDELAPLAGEYGCGVVVMPVRRKKLPSTAEERVENALAAAEKLAKYGVKPANIYVDAMAEAIASAMTGSPAVTTLETIRLIKEKTGLKSVCGASNISFGLPKRGAVNSAFLAMAVCHGLDAAIFDVTSPRMGETAAASMALCGEDEFCLDYIAFIRSQE